MNILQDIQIRHNQFSGLYRGTVVSISDTDNALRLKARIYPMMGDTVNLKDADLPWAIPCYPLLGGGSQDQVGWWVVPDVGSQLWFMFEGGDILKPIYMGEAANPVTKHDSFETGIKILRTKGGIQFILNDTLGNEDINIPNDKTEVIGNDKTSTIGNDKIEIITNDKNETISNDKVEVIKNDKKVTISGNKELTIEVSEVGTITKDSTKSIGGDWSVTVTGDATIDVTGKLIIKGSEISLNP